MLNMNPMQILSQINQLKKMYSNPEQAIQEMLQSGQITQEQLNEAVETAKQFSNMF